MMTDELKLASHYLDTMRIPIRLACVTQSGWPMAVSLWFQYQKNGTIVCATQKSARVVQYLQHEPRCAFEIAADQPPYCGLRGQAIARIDDTLGGEVLEQLLHRYLGGTENDLAKSLLAKQDSEVAIILEPVKLFTWDFSSRMKDISQAMINLATKACP